MSMRIRFAELIEEHNRREKDPARHLSAFKVAKRSGGRITLSTAYRLQRGDGGLPTKVSALLDALAEVFGVEPAQLLDEGPSRDEAAEGKRRKGRAKRGRP